MYEYTHKQAESYMWVVPWFCTTQSKPNGPLTMETTQEQHTHTWSRILV